MKTYGNILADLNERDLQALEAGKLEELARVCTDILNFSVTPFSMEVSADITAEAVEDLTHLEAENLALALVDQLAGNTPALEEILTKAHHYLTLRSV